MESHDSSNVIEEPIDYSIPNMNAASAPSCLQKRLKHLSGVPCPAMGIHFRGSKPTADP